MANKKSTPKVEKPNIKIIDDKEVGRVYANYVSVTTTPYECNLTFCRIEPLDRTPSNIPAPVVAKIMLPLSIVEETVDVISNNYEKVMKKLEEKAQKK